MSKHFQLTYTVKGGKSSPVREDIKKLYNPVNKHIETTLVGKLYSANLSNLSSMSKDDKRQDAQDHIASEIETILKDNKTEQETIVYCSLMVESLGKHIEFRV